jgi:hypothetical protein
LRSKSLSERISRPAKLRILKTSESEIGWCFYSWKREEAFN